jgi:hypothetical protein
MKNIFGSPARPDAPYPPLAAIVWCVILLGNASTAAAQSADKIIQQATKAMGGEGALKRVRGWQASGSITRQRDGAIGQYRAATMQPHLYVQAWDMGSFEVGAGFTGRSSWRRDSRDGLRTLTGEASDSFQAEAWYRNHRWIDYKK